MKYNVKVQSFAHNYFHVMMLFFYAYAAYSWLYFELPYSVAISLFLSGVGIEGMINGFNYSWNRYQLGAIFCLLFYFAWDWLIGNGVDGILSAIPILILFFIKTNDLKSSLQFITKWFSILLVPSIICYIAGYIYDLPNIGIISAQKYPDYYNCIVYLQEVNKLDLLFFRFRGPFLEPGHLAMACCFLVIANGVKFNKYLCIIYISIILSFSLAGYLILLVSIVLFKVHSIRTIFTGIGIMMLVICCIPLLDDENPFSKLIFSRLEYSEDKGIEGNNRFHGSTDKLFENSIDSMSILHGVGEQKFKRYLEMGIIDGAGYKIYFLEKGILGFFLVLSLYIFMGLNSNNKRYAIIYLGLVLLAFLQRAYIISFSWIFPYYASVLTVPLSKKKYFKCRGEIMENIREY